MANENNPYKFTDNPTVSGVSICDTDVLNEDIMHLKWRLDNETASSLFDLVEKDHELTFEESDGYEKLGNYAYKNGVSGVRYGYPEFYNRCIKEFRESTAEKRVEYESSNITPVGNLGDKMGVLFRFSNASYAKSLEKFAPGAVDKWEMVWKFKTACKFVANQWLVSPSANYKGFAFGLGTDGKLFLYLSSNGTSWNIANNKRGTKVYSINTTYFWKLEFTTDKYIFYYSTNGKSWTKEFEIASASIIFDGGIYKIGIAYNDTCPWLGSIDLNKSYIKLNTVYIWHGTDNREYTIYRHANGHGFYHISEKTVIDSVYETTGMAWYYGVDEENQRILLPRNDYYYKNDTPGEHIEAGLPNIDLYLRVDSSTATTEGVETSLGNDGVTGSNTSSADEYFINQDYVTAAARTAYLSKDFAYGNSDTVQPASVGVVVYMVVGTPSLVTAITDINIAKNEGLTAIRQASKSYVNVLDNTIDFGSLDDKDVYDFNPGVMDFPGIIDGGDAETNGAISTGDLRRISKIAGMLETLEAVLARLGVAETRITKIETCIDGNE